MLGEMHSESIYNKLHDVYNPVHNSMHLLPSMVVSVELLEFMEPVDVITYNFVSHYLSLLLHS
jgi:hypothetical protein